MSKDQTTVAFDGPNGEAIRAIANHYCIQRDPRHTSAAIAAISAECARRLTEGHMMHGDSMEAALFFMAHDWPLLKRSDLVSACVALIELMAMLELEVTDAQP